MNIIVGSKAINHHIPTFRSGNDCDVISTEKQEGADCIILPQSIIDVFPHEHRCATLDAVYTLKMSHLSWDIKWQKHKQDALFLRKYGCKLIHPLYEMLVDYWTKEYGNKEGLSLYKKKTDFFNDYVPYVYDHDYLHELVAFPHSPVYSECLKDGEDVAIDKEKFLALPLEKQLKMFKEEVSVIAAERWLINPRTCGKYNWMEAYHLALHKTVTALTKGWASLFMIEHLDYYNVPEYSYFEHLLNSVKEGEKIMAKQLTVKEKDALIKAIATEYNDTQKDSRWFEEIDLEESGLWMEIVFEGEIVKLLEQHGGEGEGDKYWAVFEYNGKTYRAYTWYASNYGVGWSEIEVEYVTPVKKMVTVYE